MERRTDYDGPYKGGRNEFWDRFVESASQQDIHGGDATEWHGAARNGTVRDNVNDASVRAERACGRCPGAGRGSRARCLLGRLAASETAT